MSQSNPLRRLAELGQSVWIDHIERSFLKNGELLRLIAQDGLSGVTSNPAIFQKAIAEHDSYDEAIAAHVRAGHTAQEMHEALMVEDILIAADQLNPVFVRTEGRDGFVSLEVSPLLARDAEATYADAKRLWALVGKNNLMVKVPGTTEGVAAIRRLIAEGINVNVTLLFTVERYAEVLEAYLSGLEDRVRKNLPIGQVASVASFFLSRIDTLLDPKLESASNPQVRALAGECALMCARGAYAHFRKTVLTARWQALAVKGARPQRLLWASTGTKDARYSDVKYVEPLIGPDTVTTLPPDTLIAYRDHGDPARRLETARTDGTVSMQEVLRAADIDWSAIALKLEEDGIKKFVAPHEAIIAALSSKRAQLQAG